MKLFAKSTLKVDHTLMLKLINFEINTNDTSFRKN